MISEKVVALVAATFLCTAISGAEPEKAAVAKKRPNIVLFFIDDLGWADLACYGSRYHETPNLDALAARGVRFTDAYSANPVCSPTRAALMTGKHPSRLGITDWIGAGQKKDVLITPKNVEHLPASELTFAEALKEVGYQTAYFGKWHLGKDDADLPTQHGFDYIRGVNRGGAPGSYHPPFRRKTKNGQPGIHDVPDLEDAPAGSYLTDLLADEAVKFVGKASEKPEPFLMVLAHYSIHTPIQPRAKDQAKYTEKRTALGLPEAPQIRAERYGHTRVTQNNPGLAGMVESVDRSVGKVLAKVKALGLEEETLILFTADNGGLSTLNSKRGGPGSNEPLRAGKGWLYEGGVRVPFIAAGAGVESAGVTSATPVMTCDIYPTLLSAARMEPKPAQHRDGLDLSSLFSGGGGLDREALYWHFPHYHGSANRPSAMVRKGGFKLVRWLESGEEELFEIGRDLSESKDVAKTSPEKRQELAGDLDRWLGEVGAKMPVLNSSK